MAQTKQTLLLDVLSWDLCADLSNNIAVASPPYAVSQDAASECRTFKGEVYYDTTRGVPYWQTFLGKWPPLSLIRAYYIIAAEQVPGVATTKVFFKSWVKRVLSGQVQVTDDDGNTSTAGF